jgi:hypothetical protein
LGPRKSNDRDRDRRHALIQLVQIHGVDTIAEPLVLGMEPPNCLLVLAPFIGMARAQCIADPVEDFAIEMQSAKQLNELSLQHLLANVAATAGSGISKAFICITGAMIVDVALLLYLPDD